MTLVCLAVLALAWPMILSDEPHPDAAKEKLRLPMTPLPWLIGIMALFSMVPEGTVLDWGALYLRNELGASVAMSGFGFAAFSATMAIMRFAGDHVRDRFGGVTTLRVCTLTALVGLRAGRACAECAAVAILGFALAGIGISNMVPIAFSAAGNMPGLAPGIGISVATFMGYSGMLFAPSLIGFIAEHTGFSIIFACVPVLFIVVLAVVAACRPCRSEGRTTDARMAASRSHQFAVNSDDVAVDKAARPHPPDKAITTPQRTCKGLFMSSAFDFDPQPRRASVAVDVGGVIVGGGAPVVVQSMTNTDTADIDATVAQVAALHRAGSELVRITVDRDESAAAVPKIRERLDAARHRRAADRRFPLYRPQAAGRSSGLRRGAGEIPHQSGQCRLQGQEGQAVRRHHRARHRIRQAGAHRRQLGFARSGTADAADGREPGQGLPADGAGR